VNRVAVLTPAGTGAIATLAVAGPTAWDAVTARFRPAKGTLPEAPAVGRFWYGTLGDGVGDEVVVAVREGWVEVHCHGGRRVVRWVVEQFKQLGCEEVSWEALEGAKPSRCNGRACDTRALAPLTQAPTLKTASILLDQYHGAFARAVTDILASPQPLPLLSQLNQFAELGRHLVAPWKVVVAGAPNVGKSSLINALAGYQRSVVAPVAGTTRDVVTVTVALDGWPVELADTAGLRASDDPLEREGVERAKQQILEADECLLVSDVTDPASALRPRDYRLNHMAICVVNKIDQPSGWNAEDHDAGEVMVSALTGQGVPELAAAIVHSLVPNPPPPGAAVPFTPALADLVETAHRLLLAGDVGTARETLTACLP
jgi:tRNA modification GTPase